MEAEIDWTTVISNLGSSTGLAGVIATVVVAIIYTRKPRHPRAAENQAVQEVSTPASPGTGSHDVVKDLISLAKEVGTLSARLEKMSRKMDTQETELGEVKEELGFFKSAYAALFGRARIVELEWDEIRKNALAPRLTKDSPDPNQ